MLAQVTIPSGTTDIDNSMISSGGNSGIGSQNIDFTTFDVRAGDTASLSLPAGKWVIVATVNALTTEEGSFLTRISWFGTTKTFQGYRVPNQNRSQGCFTWIELKILSVAATFPISWTGDAIDLESKQWLAVKLG